MFAFFDHDGSGTIDLGEMLTAFRAAERAGSPPAGGGNRARADAAGRSDESEYETDSDEELAALSSQPSWMAAPSPKEKQRKKRRKKKRRNPRAARGDGADSASRGTCLMNCLCRRPKYGDPSVRG